MSKVQYFLAYLQHIIHYTCFSTVTLDYAKNKKTKRVHHNIISLGSEHIYAVVRSKMQFSIYF